MFRASLQSLAQLNTQDQNVYKTLRCEADKKNAALMANLGALQIKHAKEVAIHDINRQRCSQLQEWLDDLDRQIKQKQARIDEFKQTRVCLGHCDREIEEYNRGKTLIEAKKTNIESELSNCQV